MTRASIELIFDSPTSGQARAVLTDAVEPVHEGSAAGVLIEQWHRFGSLPELAGLAALCAVAASRAAFPIKVGPSVP